MKENILDMFGLGNQTNYNKKSNHISLPINHMMANHTIIDLFSVKKNIF